MIWGSIVRGLAEGVLRTLKLPARSPPSTANKLLTPADKYCYGACRRSVAFFNKIAVDTCYRRMESPSLPLSFPLSLSPSLAHASAVWLMAGDRSKSAWETEYFSGKIIPLDLVCNTKAVLCFTLTLHWGRGACCSRGLGFLVAWIKNTSESMCPICSYHTHIRTHASPPSPPKPHDCPLYMHALNFALTFDFQLTVTNFKITFYLI